MAEKQCNKCGETKPTPSFMWRPERNSYYGACRACRNAQQMERLRRTGKGPEYFQRWRASNPEGYRARYDRANRRFYGTPSGKLGSLIRNAVYRSLSGRRKQKPTFDALGYTLADLMTHLERQFARGMTWGNYGEWHVDHITPLAAFDIQGTDCPAFRAAWALSNLMPLWGVENVRKQAKRTHLL